MTDKPEGDKPATANPELLELADRIAGGDAPAGGGGTEGAQQQPGQSQEAPRDDGRAAYGFARALVEGLCAVVAKRWPAAVYTDDEKHMMAALIVPVAMKRLNDPWFLKYRDEFSAGGFLVYMGYTGWARVKAAKPDAPAADRPPPSL